MKYAVVQIAAKQYRVSQGDELLVEKLSFKKGDRIDFDQVLLTVDDQKVQIGQPLVVKASVKAEILDQVKAEKIRVAKFRAKSRYRKIKGHRQQLTKIKITKING